MQKKEKKKQILEEEILIPKERIEILTDKVVKSLERKAKVKIEVDRKEGQIIIHSGDTVKNWTAKQVVEAIGRGFEPEIAQKIFIEDIVFDLVSIQDFAGKSKNKLLRLKGRIIGREGKAKRMIEKYSNTEIEIYGKTVGIIGKTGNAELARRAIEMLLSGAKHSTVYRFIMGQLEKNA